LNKLEFIDAVIALYNIANRVEEQFPYGQLSEDIQSCAERLHILIQSVKINKGTQE
tara:strand:- start:278 stop:445 length:168 start_codon:yes stop_codon:yes gene_type:complete